MATNLTVTGDALISGDLRLSGSVTPLKDRDDVLALAELQVYAIPMSVWRVHDDYHSFLPNAGAADDLGLIGGTFGTDAPSLQTSDFGANGGAEDFEARAEVALPAEYVAGQTVKIRVHAGMLTAIADAACTVDVEVYSSDKDATASGDLCETPAAANNMNSLVFDDIDFVITSGSLSPGDILDVKLKVTANDAATAVTVGCIGAVQLLCDVR